jgi:hypothetical protein
MTTSETGPESALTSVEKQRRSRVGTEPPARSPVVGQRICCPRGRPGNLALIPIGRPGTKSKQKGQSWTYCFAPTSLGRGGGTIRLRGDIFPVALTGDKIAVA